MLKLSMTTLRSFILFTILFSLNISANMCPKLSGSYRCLDPDENYDLKVSEVFVGENIRYMFNEISLISDGKFRPYTDHGINEIKNASKRAKCLTQELEFVGQGDFVSKKGRKFGEFKITTYFSMLDPHTLQVHQVGRYDLNDFGPIPVDHSYICNFVRN